MIRDFISKNTDKLLVMIVLTSFYFGSWYGYKVDNANFASASLDLVKQLTAAFLTLTVSGRFPALNTRASDGNGGANGTKTNGSVTTAGVATK